MSRFSKLAVVLAALPIMAAAAPALADSPGQLEGGSFVYQAKNLTQNSTYSNSLSASACDELQYRVWLHNTEFGNLTNVTVKVNLPATSSTSNTSTMTATTDLGGTSGTSGSTIVNLSSSQSISYENGTSVLNDVNGNVIKTLPDTITGGGVNIGTLNGSTTEYITFKAKVSCPQTTFTATASASATASANATASCPAGQTGASASASATASASASATANSTISQADAQNKAQAAAQAQANANAQAHAQASANAKAKAEVQCTAPQVKATSTVLPNTGAGDVLGIFTGASSVGAVGHYFVSRRRR